ncbi:transposase, partial [Rhodovulum sulfidophilum]|uniref:transposase n=1 Tax=Rhodovulum sulfidophilum TaxID=35806 RepID=UPI0019245F97|nr:transposase [Rhodovulum sulfidophilum]
MLLHNRRNQPLQRGSLSVWFDPGTVWQAGKTGKRGRPETFSDAAVQVCLTLKV